MSQQFVTTDDVKEALNAWNSTSSKALLDHLVLVKETRRRESAENNATRYRVITNGILLDAITQLSQEDESAGKLLRQRFLQAQKDFEVAGSLGCALPTFYRRQRKALQALTDEINQRETAIREQIATAMCHLLPNPRTKQLFGAEERQATLLTLLQDPSAARQVILTGMGGIGKTTLLNVAIRQIIAEFLFEHVIWVEISYEPTDDAQTPSTNCIASVINHIQRYMTDAGSPPANEEQMRLWFKQRHCLLIIDNVERAKDANALLKHFENWLEPSKLVMTSRPVATKAQHVRALPLDELLPADAYCLIRYLAQLGEHTEVVSAENNLLHKIYERTGGNPLAIELVVGLLKQLPLATILADLPKAKIDETEAMYTRIYWRVWRELSADAKKLFKMMPLASASGADPEHIQRVTHLNDNNLWSAIAELTSRSLLIQKGDALNPLYAIHRISEQFIKVEILKWL